VNARDLRIRLPRAWDAFFARYGNFTAIQLAAIPALLNGDNVLLSSGTASGKTEAALAPLIEKHLPPFPTISQLTILYVLPTRALINDLSTRLKTPLERLRISYDVKTRDLNTFTPKHPAQILLTTPESLDSLLANETKALIHIQAVIIDELHIFDGSTRGDQLRILLNRLRDVRSYAFKQGDAPDDQIQYAALSATLAQPQTSADRYFTNAHVVDIGGSRPISTEMIALSVDSPDAMVDMFKMFRQKGWRKALAFCNTRAEVEAYAAAVRNANTPFGSAIYAHYSNLDRLRRREIEDQFAHAEAALCFASSTLELGIDIGSIDVVLLIGPPGNPATFVQRIGRASRREAQARSICFYRTPLEKILFEALAHADYSEATSSFRPAVAVQQIFSLLKQSPTGAVRLTPLMSLFANLLSEADLRLILGELQARRYLIIGREGEWRAGEQLNRLIDTQSYDSQPLSVYSNIENQNLQQIKIRDQHTQQIVASVDRQWLDRDVLTLEGRAMTVEWYDGEAVWVSPYRGEAATQKLRYISSRQVLNFEVAQQISVQVGLSPDIMPMIPYGDGWVCFHWLGDLYGRVFIELLRHKFAVIEGDVSGLCLLSMEELSALPLWTEFQVTRHLRDHYRRYEPLLSLGVYHSLLPIELRYRAVIEQFDVPRFVHAISQLHAVKAPEALNYSLLSLIPE
jgi:ATP-dependent helicase Lhr and Lhr-like helicase